MKLRELEEAFDQIDAAIFSGDVFLIYEDRQKLREYLTSWSEWDAEHYYYTEDGTLMNSDGTRSIFDDVDD